MRSQARRARADGVCAPAGGARAVTGPPAAQPGAGLRKHLRGVSVLTVVAAAMNMTDALLRFRRFLSTTFDLVIFDQGIRGYAHFRAPVSIARGVADGGTAHFVLLSDHWSPILAVLGPLYWLRGGPAALLVAQGVLFAVAIPPLWAFTARQLSPRAAYCVAAAYALSLPIMAAVTFDFHEVAFVPVLTAVMAERFQAGRRWPAIGAAAALLLVKEDMGLLVAGYGVYLLLTRQRWTGLGFIAGGAAATWLASHLLIPAFGGSATFYWAYSQFGPAMGSAALNIVTHPLHAVGVLVTPGVKVRTMVGLLVPLGFLSLASPLVLAAVPLLAERMLASGYPLWWQAKFQYDAFIVMILFLAAVDGAARLQRQWRRAGWRLPPGRAGGSGPHRARDWPPATVWAAVVLIAALAYLPFSPFGQLLHPRYYLVNPRMAAAARAVAQVPSGAEVEAANNIGPHLSGRDTVLLLDGTPRWAPWVVADTKGLDFPFCTPGQQAQDVRYLKAHGYRQTFADDGYVVLHRPADRKTRQALIHPGIAARIHTGVCY
ncbi:MAG TPA: DUF2079 domain-containing protein [Streptosporangiaceae bacterium]